MALDANIIFRGLQAGLGEVAPVSNLLSGFQSGQQMQRNALENQLLQQRADLAPLQQRALEQELAMGEQGLAQGALGLQADQMSIDQARQGRLLSEITGLAREGLALPSDARRSHILNKLSTVDFEGLNEQELIEEINQMNDKDLESTLRSMTTASQKISDIPAEVRTFEVMTQGMTPEEKAGARKVWAGIQARAGESAEERIAREGKTEQVAESQAAIEGAKSGATESAKLDVQLEKKPEVEAKVEQKKLEVQAQVQKKIEQQGQLGRYQDALNIYSDLMPKGSKDLSKLNRIYGRGESLYPKLARSQEGINAMAQRDQLVSMLQLGARGELKGQGPITENEQAILSKAITILSEPDISPELAAQYINQAMEILGRNAGQTVETSSPPSRLEELRKKAGL